MLNVEAYLERISFQDKIQTNLSTLAALHKKHILSVPFENLDIHYGKKIVLDINQIGHKVIEHHRGGFCYELNGLFGALLNQLGFKVKLISARVFGKEKIGHEFDHLILGVSLDQEWLVDVGFGDNFLEPIQIVLGKEQHDSTGIYRIMRHDSNYLRLESATNGSGYLPKYLFNLKERRYEDFTEMCDYHQTSPETSFTRERVCTMTTENGRVTIRGERFIETINGQKRVHPIANQAEFEQILKEIFGIEIS